MMITTWRILWIAAGVPSGSPLFTAAREWWCNPVDSLEPSGGAMRVAGLAR